MVPLNEEMKLAAVHAIAGLISDKELHADYVIPDPFDPRVAAHVAGAVALAAIETDVAQRIVNVEDIKKRLLAMTEKKQPVFLG